MSEFLQRLQMNLFDEDGLKGLFDHVRNVLMATLIIAAGSYGIKRSESIELIGVIDDRLAGYVVVAVGMILVALNALGGLHKLNKQQWHIGFRIVLIGLYFFGTMRLLQLVVLLRNG